jgi:hypothetical protein
VDSLPGEDQVEVGDLGVRGLNRGQAGPMGGGDPRKGVARLNEISDECEC